MARSAAALALTASVVAGLDLAHKGLAIADRGGSVIAHDRSLLYVVGVAVASLLWAGAIALTRSVSIAVAGGILAGGALGNLASLVLWPSVPGVPNPLVAGDVAFNTADLAVLTGLTLVLGTTGVFAARNRERLRQPVRVRG
jgi:lipoprotein signal peptidase